MRRGILAVVVLLLGLAAPLPAATAAAPGLRVGSLTLHRCNLGVRAWCGSLRVPLDYTDAHAGTIRVGFGWIRGADPHGTIVAQEGGPGYPSSGTAADYVTVMGNLLRHRNLLVVDARGTGRSTPIDCRPLEATPALSPRLVAAITACGRQLNHTFRHAGGGWVHASDLFGTANATRDMARVLDALRLGRVDLYGDSYGTYFSQAFLARHPNRVRSVVLDSAYEARDLDPWYRTAISTARVAFDKVCRRAAGCAAGSSWQRMVRLTGMVRRHAIVGRVVGTDAKLHSIRVGVTALVNMVNDAGYDTDPYRQFDAAARAYLRHRDPKPLLRLYAQEIGYDYSDSNAAPTYFSDGLYFAVSCTDYPQLFSMRVAPAQRRRQLAVSIRRLPARTFAPFTTREWIRVNGYTEPYTACLTWPRTTHPADPPVPRGVSMNPRHVPVLILNGELDSLTPAPGGAHIARQLGRSAHAHVAANTVHLVALENPHVCGSLVVRRFFSHPHLRPDLRCLRQIPAIRAVPVFPRTLAATPPVPGRAPVLLRKLARIAVATAGDAINRYDYVDGAKDLGLRGGRVHYDDAGDATLRGVRFVRDAPVSGTVTLTDTGARGRVTVRGTPVRVRWGSGRWATADVRGRRARVPAP